jgi:hypothetical protein
VEKVIQNSPETTAIRQRMDEVRCDLDEDVQEIVEGAREIGKWRSCVRAYPWVCLGVTLVAGYWVVPRRRFGTQSDAQSLGELANQSGLLPTSRVLPTGNVRGTLLALVGKLVMRGVSTYVGQQASKLFATQATNSQPVDPP